MYILYFCKPKPHAQTSSGPRVKNWAHNTSKGKLGALLMMPTDPITLHYWLPTLRPSDSHHPLYDMTPYMPPTLEQSTQEYKFTER